MEIKLNLGCGRDYKEGYENVDISRDVPADGYYNVINGIPKPANTYSEVIVNNVLTQIEKSTDFVSVMNELWSVTRPTGAIYIRVPNAKDDCAFQDPMDCRRFTEETFTYMEDGHRRYEQYGKHYGFRPFKVEMLSNNGRQMEFKLTPIK